MRQCCIAFSVAAIEQANRVALTRHHPASRQAIAFYDGLTDAEQVAVKALSRFGDWAGLGSR